MLPRQIKPEGVPLEIELRPQAAIVSTLEPGPKAEAWTFRLLTLSDLTERLVEEEVMPAAGAGGDPLLVYFDRASPSARALLREREISFIGAGGECFLYSPPLIVDREPPTKRRARSEEERRSEGAGGYRNPFARNASRVIRLLLLAPDRYFSIRELARAAEVSDALVSRAVQSLHEESWVEVARDPGDNRARRVRVRRPREALSAWGQVWSRRRLRVEHWDIRATSAEKAMERLRVARERDPEGLWALGGLAGASLLNRVVEPASALVWIAEDQLVSLEEMLMPRITSRGQASLTVAVMPDEFVLGLAEERDDLPVADPVQLWLDCAGEGERALEAADAIARMMGW